MEHIKLNKLSSNSEEIEFDCNFNGVYYLIIVDVEYWTIKQDSYGISGGSWNEVDAESFDISISIYDEEENKIPSTYLAKSEVEFIEQECINYLNYEIS